MWLKEKIKEYYRTTKNFIKSSLESKPLFPGESLVQIMHWWARWVFGLIFIIIWFDFIENKQYCFNLGDGSPIPKYREELCKKVSFATLEEQTEENIPVTSGVYFPYLALSLSFLYTCMECFSVLWGQDQRISKVINECYLDTNDSSKQDKMKIFLQANIGGFHSVFYRSLTVHIFLLLFDAAVLYFLHYMIHDKLLIVFQSLLKRNHIWQDTLDLVYPSYTTCKITPDMAIAGRATVIYRCYNPAMKHLQKLFMIMIGLLVVLLLFTLLQLAYLFTCLCLPCVQKELISPGGIAPAAKDIVSKKLCLGDVMVLNTFRVLLSGRRYTEVIVCLAKQFQSGE